MKKKLTADRSDAGTRLDQFLTDQLQDENITRSQIRKWIQDEGVQIDGHPASKAGTALKGSEIIELNIPDPQMPDAEPEPIPIEIVYEDDDIAIVNKPKGLVVHPSAGHPNGTLVNALMYHFQGQLSGIGGVLRPGIVHRIDRDTTGLLVVCKNDLAHQVISERLAVHDITRRYHAIVIGRIQEETGTIDQPIGRDPADRKKMAVAKNGKRAVTHFRVLERFQEFTYVELILETGRTHQIRVHMKSIGHPVLSDPIYGPGHFNAAQKKALHGLDPELFEKGQFLHAKTLGLVHPVSGVYMEWDSELPEDFQMVLQTLEDDGADPTTRTALGR